MFWQVLGPKEHELAEQNEYNFDHPDAFDFDLLIKTLRRLKEGKKVEVPIYNFVTHGREKHSVNIYTDIHLGFIYYAFYIIYVRLGVANF